MRIFVIGNEDCVLGFALVGVAGQAVYDKAEAERVLDACLADKSIVLLLMTSDVAQWTRERVDILKVNTTLPLVVEIPGEGEQIGALSLKEYVQRAIGLSLGGG
jgi:V/A-type H+/Na+-transporting ATPase subunit F